MTDNTQNDSPNPVPTKTIGYYQYLSERVMAGTRGARFTAARLLIFKERASLVIQSVLAVLLIWVSVILLAYPNIDDAVTRKLGIVSTMASVAILGITLFEYALGRGLLAAKLHDSALRTTVFMRKLERELAKPNPSSAVLEQAAEEYEQENVLTNVNHSAMDFTLHEYSRARSNCWVIEAFFRTRSFFAQASVVALAVSPGLLTLAVIMYQAWDLPFLEAP
ncbi:SLATT domain-containing protein [Pseudorhizobium pelagicum]|nr:SLATT domain-containing protein [Pseudorhizobium pelagicum]